jgi:hypothetical protein
MRTFKHGGKIGDVIFSLPYIKCMGGGVLYLPERTHECPALYSQLKPLLEQQDYIQEVREYPSMLAYGELAEGIHIDFDLDKHREHLQRGRVNMVKRYFDVFGLEGMTHCDPWLMIKGEKLIDHEYNLIHVTERFRENSRVGWKRVCEKMDKPYYFIGTDEEYENFIEKYCQIKRLCTTDFLTFAIYIRDCSSLFCNQSSGLAIAASINKERHVEFKPRKTNCKFYTETEYELL